MTTDADRISDAQLASRFGTPLLRYDWDVICRQAQFLLARGVTPMMTVRICPEPEILSRLTQLGCGLVCCSALELQLAEGLSCRPREIWLDSLLPSREAVSLAVKLGARVAVCDYTVGRQVIAWGAKRLLVRFQQEKPAGAAGRPHVLMERLQMYNRQLIQLVKLLDEDADVVLETVADAKPRQPGAWTEAASRLPAGVRTLHREYADRLGGFSLNLQGPPDGDCLERELPSVKTVLEKYAAPLFLHCGRSLVEQAGTLVCRVEHIRLGAPDMAILDASAQHLPRSTALGGSHSYRLDSPQRDGYAYYDLVGRLPEREDTIVRKVLLPRLRPGDILGIRGVGAYERAMASCYGGDGGCPVVLVDGEEAYLLRRRRTAQECQQDIVTP